MKNRLAFWVVVIVSTSLMSLASCGSDEEGKGAGGSGGAAGSGGSAGSNSWKKGVIGKAGTPQVIMRNGGPILGISLKEPAMRTMDGELDGGLEDADAGQTEPLPDVIPKVDFGQTKPSSDFVIITPPYSKLGTGGLQPAEQPYAVTYKPNGEIGVDRYFPNWKTDWTIDCFITKLIEVNGNSLYAYTGVTFDIETKLNRFFFATSAMDAVYELTPNSEPKILAQGFGLPSTLMAHPQGFLVVTTLPGYQKSAPKGAVPILPAKLMKIGIDEPHEVEEIASLPIPSDYENISGCEEFESLPYSMPTSIRISLALKEDGSYWMGDVGAKRLYNISPDGKTVTEVSSMPMLVVALIAAPNDVLYMVTPPILGNQGGQDDPDFVAKGVTIYALDEAAKTWVEVVELDGYEGYEDKMSWGKFHIPCPPELAAQGIPVCKQPIGIYFKVVPDITPLLFVSDPITARLFEIPLDMDDTEPADAGIDAEAGSAGSAGSSGAGGIGGASGSAGSAGSAGSSGASGTSGNAGTAGSAGSAGSAGGAGSSGTAGSAGTGNP